MRDAAVDSDSGSGWFAQVRDRSRAGKEVIRRIFSVDAAFDRVTLPVDVFLRDEEFISGHLDTGFITRFNERRAASEPASPSVTEEDLAAIAAALVYTRERQRSSMQMTAQRSASRWKMDGRKAAM